MDLASVVAALASVGVRVSGSTPNNNIQGDSSRACPTGLAGPEPSGTLNDPGQHFQGAVRSRFPPTWLGVAGAAAARPRGGAFVRCVGRSGPCVPLPSSARPLGGLSGSALRACGCGGPALCLRGGERGVVLVSRRRPAGFS